MNDSEEYDDVKYSSGLYYNTRERETRRLRR